MTIVRLQDHFEYPLLVDLDHTEAMIWDTGAGHADPEKANDPGLVYVLRVNDYVQFLCASNYSGDEIRRIAKRQVRCDRERMPWDLNYLAIVVYPNEDKLRKVVVKSSVTNVGKTGPGHTLWW